MASISVFGISTPPRCTATARWRRGQLLRYLAYKAEEAGRQLIAVDPRNTSRTCAV
ncbi:MAG: zinc ribbon domain-containing protein, partial [Acidimicrobiales bacterium]